MSPAWRRALVAELVSLVPKAGQRKVCAWLAWARSSVRYQPRSRPREARLKAVLPLLAQACPRDGYRRIRETLKSLGERVNRKCVQRLWQLLKLQVKPRKRHRTRHKPLPEALGLRAQAPNHVWCLDFMKDWTLKGTALRILSVVDEYTRECLALVPARSFRAHDVVALLEWLGFQHGTPGHVRSDNGPEFIATDVARWARAAEVELVRSAPGCPWHNPYSETFHSRARDEFTEGTTFGSLAEAEVLCDAYREWYNTARRHSALKYETPAAFAARVRTTGPGLGRPGLVMAHA